MKANGVAKPELLAPAGSLDVFATAVEEGADAVYIGAPELNARALARHFTPEELASMIDYGRRAGVKVYLAMNSLVKEEEIPRLVELLALLEQLGPDALIIQDLGLYSLVKKHFPSFVLHASTLMGAHNSLAVRQFADMGFKRVVLAREVTLEETEKIHRQCPVELEAFVHGALCFSYSGLCLFSSYLGGKSSMRGRCVQPCRRKYGWAGGEGREQGQGYFFSMNDLEGVDLLPRMARAGIVSLKIEGRMRSQSYVGAVVRAYRKMLDAGDNIADVLPQARELLHQAMGRTPTGGYFLAPQPADAITPYSSGNIGHLLGKIEVVRQGELTLTLEEAIESGDRVRLHHEESGDRASFTVRDVLPETGGKGRGEKGERVTLVLAGVTAEPGDLLYKVDVRSRRQMEARKSRLSPPGQFHRLVEKIKKSDRAARVIKALGVTEASEPAGKKQTGGRRGPASRQRMPLWVRGDLRVLSQPPVERPDRVIVTLDRETAAQLRQKKMRHAVKIVTCALPPVILEDDVSFYRQLVTDLLRMGCRNWMISHIGQLQLFNDGGKRSPAKSLASSAGALVGDYTLNALNSLTLELLRENGISATQISIETDRENLRRMCAAKKKGVAGLTVYARPALFTARLHPEFFQFNKTFVSPRGERFILQQKWGQTLALPERPFSLLGQLMQLREAGLDFAVIDLSHVSFHKKEIAALRRALSSQPRGRSQESFNYFRTLQ